MSEPQLAALRNRVEQLFELEGANAGAEFRTEPHARRLANLIDKGEVFRSAMNSPEILELVSAVLGPDFKLSSLNVRSANPFSPEGQPLHCDMGVLPDARGNLVCNTVWMLDDFTEENGALRIVPESHKWGQLPQEAMSDPLSAHPQEELVTGKAGTVVVMNSHLWHGGTANRTGVQRRAMHGFFCRSDIPQQQYQKELLRPETQAALNAQLRKLLALDDPLNDELSSKGSNRSGFMR